ncbi:ArdC family protein [Agrobacterium tumefaciens]|uniref:ArdC family protein n=1 Tax=Agrobacterium tumefaciens TaxID=358 RepID=UPI001CBBF80C|nr:ArdC-like ssDNA-binding domain-containing protein [Agrobacterium tumefaciens]
MTMKSEAGRADIYTRITDRIVEDLEKGVRPWMRPWSAANTDGRISRPLRHNGLPYSGVNVLLLWSEQMSRGFASSMWMTFKQALELGGAVRKGEAGSTVVFASRFTKSEADGNGNEVDREIPFLKAYSVFNVEQIDGLPGSYYAPVAEVLDPVERIESADRFFRNTGAVIRHGGNQAYYSPVMDYIQMPPFEAFRDAAGYAAVLSHEATHYAAIRIMPNVIRTALELNTNSALMVGIIATGLLSVGYTGRWKSALASSTETLISHPETWSLMSPIACMKA